MSAFTNRFNLPRPLYIALTTDNYKGGGDISVTSLILPVRIRALRKRYKQQIVEDASDRVWSLLGNACHYVVEQAAAATHLTEERLSMKLNGWVLSGQTDVYEPEEMIYTAKGWAKVENGVEGILSDYKITSVYAIKRNKAEWDQQTNLNAMLFRNAGFKVGRVQIIAIIRDWSRTESVRNPNYPQSNAVVQPIPLWSNSECVTFASRRILEHQGAEKLSDDELPECTPSERWYSGESFAVMIEGNKRATRVLSDPLEAKRFRDQLAVDNANKVTSQGRKKPDNRPISVVRRPGVNIRCENYCNVRDFCSFWKQLQQDVDRPTGEEEAEAVE